MAQEVQWIQDQEKGYKGHPSSNGAPSREAGRLGNRCIA